MEVKFLEKRGGDKVSLEKNISKMFDTYIKMYELNKDFSLTVSPIITPLGRRLELSYCPTETNTEKTIDIFNVVINSSIFAIEIHNDEIILKLDTMESPFSFEDFHDSFYKIEELLKGWIQRKT